MDFCFHDAGVENQWPRILHGHFHRSPGAPPVGTECPNQVGLLTVTLCDGTAHRITPNHLLTMAPKKYWVGVGKLDIPLAHGVIENGHGFAPAFSIVLREGHENIAHIFLTVTHGSVGDDQITFGLTLNNERLPDPPGLWVLFDSTNHVMIGDIPQIGFFLSIQQK